MQSLEKLSELYLLDGRKVVDKDAGELAAFNGSTLLDGTKTPPCFVVMAPAQLIGWETLIGAAFAAGLDL